MATFFEEDSSSISKPFVNDYVTEQKKFKSEVFYISEIRPSKKGTGLLLTTENFTVFLFKNSKSAKRVTEICEKYSGESYYPLIVRTIEKDPYYCLGLDDEATGYYEVKKDDFLASSSWLIGTPTSNQESSNPQSPPIPALASPTESLGRPSGSSTPAKSSKAS